MRPPIAVLLLLATPVALLLRPTESTTKVVEVRTHVITVPDPIVMRFQQEPPSVASPACPAPRRDAPRLTPPELPEPVNAVVVSPTNAGWIAAYNDDNVFVSTDAGKTFDEVLDEDGDVHAVGFDCFGNVIAVRDGRVGVRDYHSTETWRVLPGLDLEDRYGDAAIKPLVAVIGGGPHVAILGHADDVQARVAISRDLGATWGYHDLHEYFEGPTFGARQLPDGSIDIALEITDCDSYQVQWSRITNAGIEREIMPGEASQLVFVGDRLFADDRWRTWASPDGAWKTAKKLPRVNVDPAGRAWAVHCNKLRITTEPEPTSCSD